jgi:signal transduction histidine kinase
VILPPFRRGRRTDLPARGTGMGLPIVKAIINVHGGWVEVDSEPGVWRDLRNHPPPTLRRPRKTDRISVRLPSCPTQTAVPNVVIAG